ncbi:unnamed protein product [Linum tenue]|uniref:Uncharacterized protein n=1 Tax=Linum tenue TaxID=586396 RepID=A0AAV0JAN0_9ROSI|nr:unnamed protein product [Linum tenue]
MKSIKALIHSLIVAHICRAFRALRRAKSILLQALRDHKHDLHHFPYLLTGSHNNSKQKKVFFGSFRLHYNWGSTSSSHVLPVPESVLRGCHGTTGADQSSESTLAGYLLWLEEKDRHLSNNKACGGGGKDGGGGGGVVNEIDMLAEMFIADCHEKFQLEKQESLRRFHEMLARSM